MRVVVSIPPLAWVVREVAPEGTEIVQITPTGVGCEGVDLTPGHVIAIDRADVVVLTGLGLEPQIERALRRSERPGRRIASFITAPDVADRLIEADGASHAGHSHGPGHEHCDHGDGSLDPHAWLDPTLMAAFAQGLVDQMAAALDSIEPDPVARQSAVDSMRSGLQRVQSACELLDQSFRSELASTATRTFITEHNGYAYLARRYDLQVVAAIRALHEVEPAPGDIEAAAKSARAHDVRAIFVEPQYSQAGARRVAEVTGLRLLTIDALGDGDYPGTMRRNLDALVAGLNGPAPAPRSGEEG